MATFLELGDFLTDRGQDRSEIIRIIEGGMGLIYIVFDHKSQQVRAVKTFKDEYFDQDPSITTESFREEALKKLSQNSELKRLRLEND